MSVVNICSFFLLYVLFSACQSAKILAVFPTPSISHQVVFRPYIYELVRRGHEVVLITPDPAFPKGQSPVNLTEIDVHDISYEHWEEILSAHDGKKENILKQLINLFYKFTSTFEKQILTDEVQRILREEGDSFDLIVAEASVRTALGLGHLLKKPIIQFSSYGGVTQQYSMFGALMHPIVFPTPVNQRLYNLSTREKIWEYFKFLVLELLCVITYDNDISMAKRRFGDDMPSFDEATDKYVQMLFINEHPIWADNRPVPPNIIYVGGIHQPVDKELPKDLQAYLDSSKNGLIYISFGTNVRTNTLSIDTIKLLTSVLSKLPYNVLWKWDEDELDGKTENIKISKWLPQAQVLKHPNIKLFITQGGLQSTDEAINAAVPVIGIPMLGDQWYNTEKYVHLKIGMQLDILSLTEAELTDAVITVIEDKSYKENMLKLRSLMREHPISPLDSAVWWTEHIIRHGGSHLRSPAFNITFYSYYELPLLLTLISVCVIIIFTSMFVLRKLKNFLFTNLRVKYKKL